MVSAMYESAQAAITEYHRLGASTTDIYFLIVLGTRSPTSGFQLFHFLVRTLPGLKIGAFLLYVLTWPFLDACGKGMNELPSISSYRDTTSPIRSGPTLMTSFKLNYFLRG